MVWFVMTCNILAYFTLVGALVTKPLINARLVGLLASSPQQKIIQSVVLVFVAAYPISKLQTFN
jgi:hypothetical protein